MTGCTVALIGAVVLIVVGFLAALRAWRMKRSSQAGIISAKATLEALIPAIMDIERGYLEHVLGFVSDANKGLERLGSPYRFITTSKTKRVWDVTGEYVDTITVIETAGQDDHGLQR